MELRLLSAFCIIAFFSSALSGPANHRYHSNNNELTQSSTTRNQPRISEERVLDLLNEICQKIKDEVKEDVPMKFSELVHSVKRLDQADLNRINSKIESICESRKLQDLWSDALIMDASESSLKIIVDQIQKTTTGLIRRDYLLSMIGLAARPSLGSVRAVLPLLDQESRQALLGASSLIRSHLNAYPENRNSREVKEALQKLFVQLNKVQSEQNKPEKIITVLKAIQNIGFIAEEQLLDSIIRIASDNSQKSSARVSALECLISRSADQKVMRKALEIFRNTNEESELRIAAYKTCIESADRQIIMSLLSVLTTEQNQQGK